VTDQQTVLFFEDLLDLTETMTAARLSGNWDTVNALQIERQNRIAAQPAGHGDITDPASKARVKEICQKILAHDQETLVEATTWRDQIKQFFLK
jgi:hypothetical protein